MQVSFSSENIDHAQLYPFCLTRGPEDIRVGIFSIRERWLRALEAMPSLKGAHLRVAANVVPGPALLETTARLLPGQAIRDGAGHLLLQHVAESGGIDADLVADDYFMIEFGWEIFQRNSQAIAWDFDLAVKGRLRAEPNPFTFVSEPARVFIEQGATVQHAIINADEGPVFIEQGAKVMEGALLRGPLYIGAGAVVKMGTKIYGGSTIGPGCVVGGEIKNSVLFEHSNKAHDGYLGDSVIGAWCNLGGGTTNSNLKNTGGVVTVHLQDQTFAVGKKCGMLMGDFSRTAINTSINTGAVIGVGANVFGNGLTPKHIPSFSWGFDDIEPYQLEKALRDAAAWKAFKGQVLTPQEIQTLTTIYKSKIEIK